MSNFLVTGTSPNDYLDDAEAWRIHDCPVCTEPFREDRGVEVEERFYCSGGCVHRAVSAQRGQVATAAYVVTDGKQSSLVIFTASGESFDFNLTDSKLLLESLQRAMKAEKRQTMNDALLVRPQPKSVEARSANGRSMEI